MSSLPDEIYIEILLRLQVKSTLVCKSVCKNWYALISDPDFVKKHHNLTIEKTKFRLMISGYDAKRSRKVIYSVSYDPSSLSKNEFHMYGVEIDWPLECLKFDIIHSWKLMGSSNGFLCIWSRSKDIFCLWNPDSKECMELPKSPNKPNCLRNVYTYAYGYDYSTGDFKLVCLHQKSNGFLVEVYTMGLNSWKTIQVIPYYEVNGCGVLVNEAFHWLCYGIDHYSKVIISLDVSSETFTELQPPTEPLWNMYQFENLGELKKCLCVLACDAVNVEIWVMQDYGVQESWTRHYTITNEINVKQLSNIRFIWSLNSGQILFLRFCYDSLVNLILYDPKDGSAINTNVHVSGSDEYNYLHSLHPRDFQYLCGGNAN